VRPLQLVDESRHGGQGTHAPPRCRATRPRARGSTARASRAAGRGLRNERECLAEGAVVAVVLIAPPRSGPSHQLRERRDTELMAVTRDHREQGLKVRWLRQELADAK
jgi:hypothetical protein